MKNFQNLDDFLDFAWVQISRGKADKKSPARHPTFITLNTNGFPNARTLVMRQCDRESNQIEFHTDTFSSKMLSLISTNIHSAFPPTSGPLRPLPII